MDMNGQCMILNKIHYFSLTRVNLGLGNDVTSSASITFICSVFENGPEVDHGPGMDDSCDEDDYSQTSYISADSVLIDDDCSYRLLFFGVLSGFL